MQSNILNNKKILSDADKNAVYQSLFLNRSTFKDFATMNSSFRELILFKAISLVSNKDLVTDVINEFADLISKNDIEMSQIYTNYANATYERKTFVNTAILNANPSNITSLKNVLKTSMLQTLGTNSNGSSALGKSGGSSYISVDNTNTIAEVPNKTNPFIDLEEVAWAKESISELYARGVVKGKGNNEFMPNDKVTRAEFIEMLITASGLADNNAVSSLVNGI